MQNPPAICGGMPRSVGVKKRLRQLAGQKMFMLHEMPWQKPSQRMGQSQQCSKGLVRIKLPSRIANTRKPNHGECDPDQMPLDSIESRY